jgi:four helix bundle protein
MNKITSYRDLLVWQRAMELVAECYRLTQKFPKNEEFGLKAQMRRAAISIPSNIAEGHTRHHGKEFVQFLYLVLGSLAELETQLELSRVLAYLDIDESEKVIGSCQELGRMLNGLKNAISRNRDLRSNSDTRHLTPVT